MERTDFFTEQDKKWLKGHGFQEEQEYNYPYAPYWFAWIENRVRLEFMKTSDNYQATVVLAGEYVISAKKQGKTLEKAFRAAKAELRRIIKDLASANKLAQDAFKEGK